MKNSDKRFLAFIMALVMCLSLMPSFAFAAEMGSASLDEISEPAVGASEPAEENADAVGHDMIDPEEEQSGSADADEEDDPVSAAPEEEAPADEPALDGVGGEEDDPVFPGVGSEEEPYEIASEGSFRTLAELVNAGSEDYAAACYILTADIAFTSAWTPVGTAENPFTGSFNGNGKKLTGLCGGSGDGYFGLFGAAKDAVLSGLSLQAVNIKADGYEAVGAIVGYMQGGALRECCVMGTVNAEDSKNCGGLAGKAEGVQIGNCFSTVEMEATGYVGGIAGLGCSGTTMEYSYNIGFIYSTDNKTFGSILGGFDSSVSLESCYCIDTTDKNAEFLTRDDAADPGSFGGFDFDGVWTVDKSSEYPYPVLRNTPCQCDEAWAPDTTVHSMGYEDTETHNIPMSENALNKAAANGEDMLTSIYLTTNLPAVRDQDPYGTCWAHSIMAAAEVSLIRKGYADSSINLSELQFAWFHHYGTLNSEGEYEDPLNNFGGDHNYSYGDSYGFWGGDNYFKASKSVSSWIGPIEEDSVTAYTEANAKNITPDNVLDYSYAFSKDAAHLENVKMIPVTAGIDVIKAALLEYGVLCLSYFHDSTYTTSYSRYFYAATGSETNHAVAIVGWDDTVSKDLFRDSNAYSGPSSDGAWIVRNSWGSSWGDGGYFYMSYESWFVSADSGNCLFAYDFEPADNYEKCYQYDGSACPNWSITLSGSKPSVANIFTADGNDTICAVSFWMEYVSDVSYNVKVYTDLTNASNPTSGTLAAQVSGQTDYAGYYTVPLPTSVSVNKGDKFSVVVETTNKSSVQFAVDSSHSNNNSTYLYYVAHSSDGQSFYSQNGSSWGDMSKNDGGNFRIKAFTVDNAPAAPVVSLSQQSGSLSLSWAAVSDAANYDVYRSVLADSGYSKIGTVSSTSYTDTSAESGTVYYYKVKAVGSNEKVSGFSNAVSGLIGTQTRFVVFYDANEGSGAPDYQIKTKGTALTLRSEIPTRNGYFFLGWAESSSAESAEYQPGDSFTTDADTTLYAIWLKGVLVSSPDELESEHPYTDYMDQKWYYIESDAASMKLTFDSQTETESYYDPIYIYDGSGNEIGQYSGTKLAGATVTIPGDTVCIRLTSDGSKTYWGFKVSDYSFTPKQFTVSFSTGEGTAVDSQTIDIRKTATKPDDPTRVGYAFGGWLLNGAPFDFSTPITEDITLTAKWITTTTVVTATNGTTAAYCDPGESSSIPGVTANGLEDVARAVKDANPTANVLVSLGVETGTENTDIKTAAATAGKEGFTFLNISLTKQIGTAAATSISDTEGSVLEIVVPFNMTNRGQLVVYRYHNGVTQFTEAASGSEKYGKDGTYYIEGTGTSAKVHFFTDKFSDYALAYAENDSGVSLTLDGTIGVNFYVDVGFWLENQAVKYPNAYVKLYYPTTNLVYGDGGTCRADSTSKEYRIDASGAFYNETEHAYKYTCQATSGQMTEKMKVELYDGVSETPVYTREISVAAWCQARITNRDAGSDLLALCEAILDYGYASQTFFKYVSADGSMPRTAYSTAFTSASEASALAYINGCNNDAGEVVYGDWWTSDKRDGISFMALSDSAVRFYYKGDAISAVAAGGDPTCSVAKYGVRVNKDSHFYEVSDIPAAELHKSFTLNTVNGTIRACGLSYAKKVLNAADADQQLKNLSKALVLYNQAAIAYFNK